MKFKDIVKDLLIILVITYVATAAKFIPNLLDWNSSMWIFSLEIFIITIIVDIMLKVYRSRKFKMFVKYLKYKSDSWYDRNEQKIIFSNQNSIASFIIAYLLIGIANMNVSGFAFFKIINWEGIHWCFFLQMYFLSYIAIRNLRILITKLKEKE